MQIDPSINCCNDDKIKITLDHGYFMPTLTTFGNKKKIILGILAGLIGAFFVNKFGSDAVFHVLPKVPDVTSSPLIYITILVLFYILCSLGIFGLLYLLFPGQIIEWLSGQLLSGKRLITLNETNIHSSSRTRSIFRLLVWICFGSVSFLYIFTEWIFFITKPSFMDAYSFGEKVSVLLSTYSTIVILLLPVLAGIALISRVNLNSRISSFVTFVAAIIPAIISSMIVLLLIDNFTYTILGFGIVNTEGIIRLFYTSIFMLLVLYYITKFIKFLANQQSKRRVEFFALALIIPVAAGLIFTIFTKPGRVQNSTHLTKPMAASQPNIILLGSDGVNADRMSIYGYERETTPTLDSLAGNALVAESNFTNCGQSSGSVVSIFTGRIPYATRVVNVQDTLQNADAYLHLPRILREMGYTNTSITHTRYLDAYSLNFQDGFDRVNGKSIDSNPVMRLLGKLASDRVQYFLMTSFERISDRINHIFFIQQMPNPFGEVYTSSLGEDREKRLNELFNLIDTGERPFFVHVHLMGTHGPRFAPELQVFSSGIEQNKDGMPEYYDDSILNFDQYIGEVIDRLEKAGIRENTVIIIYSDHPRTRVVPKRIPLIFLFPDGQYAGKITANTQNIDIAPTILDYLNQPIPEWMDGVSLLDGPPDLGRPVLGSAARAKKTDNPFFSFGIFSEVVCQNYAYYTARTGEWTFGEVEGKPTPCQGQDILTHEEIKTDLIQELFGYGFNTDLLKK